MLHRLSLRYKIGFIALVGFFGFFIYQTATYRMSVQSSQQLQKMTAQELPVLQFANRLQLQFSNLNENYQSALAELDLEFLEEAQQKANTIANEFDALESEYNVNTPLFLELKDSFNGYIDKTYQHTKRVLQQQVEYDEILAGYKEVSVLRDHYLLLQKKFLDARYQSFEARLYKIEEEKRLLVRFGMYLGLFLTAFLGVFSIFIIRRILATFEQAVHVAQEIASGRFDEDIQITSEDETGQLLASLSTMRDSLQQEQQASIQRVQEQSFLAGLSDAMRGDQQEQTLSHSILIYLLAQFEAQVAAFYVVKRNELVRINQIAYPDEAPKRYDLNTPSFYTNLANRQEPLITTELPESYTLLKKVLQPMPRWLLIMPIVHGDKLQAIIEIAAFKRLEEKDLLLLKQANDAIAISLMSAQSRYKLANMLLQTQHQAEELDKQKQALAVINNQLEDKNKVLDEQKSEILEKNQELEFSRKELMKKTSALEVSGKYKSQFLSTMSHELRTPLNSILILSQALQENRDNHLNEKEIEHAKVIQYAGTELLTLINDILDLSKVEEGKMELVIEPILFSDIAQELRYQFEFVAKEKGLYFTVDLADDLPDCFYSDKQRLNQIIRNFISNALKFTTKGGITVEVVRVKGQSHLVKSKQQIAFNVVDTGLGIEKSKQQLVFEAFKQADGTTSRKYGGSGLGLTISKELSELLGGKISLSSDGLGYGSTFSLLLSIGDVTAITDAASANAEPVFFSESADRIENYPIFDKVLLPEQVLQEDVVILIDKDEQRKLFEHVPERLFGYCYFVNSYEELTRYLQKYKPLAIVLSGETKGFSAQDIPCYQLVEELSIKPCQEGVITTLSSPRSIEVMLEDIILGQTKAHARVLFIEDNPVFYQVINTLFTKKNILVDIVEDGTAAMQKLTTHLYDYLVVDLNLPDFSGREIIKAVRSLSSYSHKKVVLFTAEDVLQNDKLDILQYADELIPKSPQAIFNIADDAQATITSKSRKQRKSTSFQKIITADYVQGSLKDKVILLVDDDERNLYSTSSILEAEGLIVHQAQSGLQALDILANNRNIELVLLDIMMPEMDGFEVLAKIRKRKKTRTLPVVTLTAKAMSEDRQACIDAGASDYLSKPVDVKKLLDTLAAYLVDISQ